MWSVLAKTERVAWRGTGGEMNYDMYPTLAYPCQEVSWISEVPGELGKCYVQIKCDYPVLQAMQAASQVPDPRLAVVSASLIEEPEV